MTNDELARSAQHFQEPERSAVLRVLAERDRYHAALTQLVDYAEAMPCSACQGFAFEARAVLEVEHAE